MTGRHRIEDIGPGQEGFEVALLERWSGGADPLTDDAIESARDRLLAEMREPTRAPSRPSAGRRRVLAASVAAALTLVLALGVSVVLPVGEDGTAPGIGLPAASAAELLAEAADHAIVARDAALRPGQWVHVTLVDTYGCAQPGCVDEPTHFWIPQDRAGDWYLSRTDFNVSTPTVVSARGEFYGAVKRPDWETPTTEFFAGLPRDPVALRARLYRDTKHQGNSRDEGAMEGIAALLRTGRVPADVRAAVYRVLATIPGVKASHATTLDGRTGVAFGRAEPKRGGDRTYLIVDQATGDFIGERTVSHSVIDGTEGPPMESALRYEVVDEVPAAVRANASRQYWCPDPSGRCES